MKISKYNTQDDLSIDLKSIDSIVINVLKDLGIETDEIIINFVSSEKIQNLHEEFFGDASETDCITFPIDGFEKKSDNHHIIGEVFVCPKVALKVMPNNPYEETTLYLIHTLLHLAGYEDTSSNLKSIMDLKQNDLLETIKTKKLLLTN